MDKGAHFYRCDLQVHTPRDRRWSGTHYVSDEDRGEYASRFIQACRGKGLDAVAITDHHDLTYVSTSDRPQKKSLMMMGVLSRQTRILSFSPVLK